MSTKLKFTIVIPTRERADVLYYCLKSACAQDYPNLEILVSDNFSQDNTEEIVKQFSDNRIRYINTGKRVSMSHNWEFALSHITKGWVTILGDDDAILPGAIQKVLQISTITGVKAVRSKNCEYAWPSIRAKQYGKLNIDLSCRHEVRNSNYWILQVMKGRKKYSNLPVLYTGGFVDISVLQSIKRITGSIYLSMTPDVYSGFAIAHTISNYVYSYEALAINGASIHSNGSSFFSENMASPNSPAALFCSEPNIAAHKHLALKELEPLPKSIQACVYECYLQSLPHAKHKDLSATPQRQLEIILNETARSRPDILKWAAQFSEYHGLTVPAKRNKLALKGLSRYLKAIKRRIIKMFDHVIEGSRHQPLGNVFEASLVAAHKIKNAPRFPNKILKNIRNFVIRVLPES